MRIKLHVHIIQGMLSGMLIALGALAYATVIPTSSGIAKLLASFLFSSGLILSTLLSGKLYTGRCAYYFHTTNSTLNKVISLLETWIFNLMGVGLFILLIGTLPENVSNTLVTIGTAKANLSITDMIGKGILCNMLVCIATLKSLKINNVTDLLITMSVPVALFVLCGFEHSIANMFFIPMAVLCGASIPILTIVKALVLVTIGNFIGGIIISWYNKNIE